MCPEVRNSGPGVWPSCGMALEPETVSLPMRFMIAATPDEVEAELIVRTLFEE